MSSSNGYNFPQNFRQNQGQNNNYASNRNMGMTNFNNSKNYNSEARFNNQSFPQENFHRNEVRQDYRRDQSTQSRNTFQGLNNCNGSRERPEMLRQATKQRETIQDGIDQSALLDDLSRLTPELAQAITSLAGSMGQNKNSGLGQRMNTQKVPTNQTNTQARRYETNLEDNIVQRTGPRVEMDSCPQKQKVSSSGFKYSSMDINSTGNNQMFNERSNPVTRPVNNISIQNPQQPRYNTQRNANSMNTPLNLHQQNTNRNGSMNQNPTPQQNINSFLNNFNPIRFNNNNNNTNNSILPQVNNSQIRDFNSKTQNISNSFPQPLLQQSNSLDPNLLQNYNQLSQLLEGLTNPLQSEFGRNPMDINGLALADLVENSNSMGSSNMNDSLGLLRVLSNPNSITNFKIVQDPQGQWSLNVSFKSQKPPTCQPAGSSCIGNTNSQSVPVDTEENKIAEPAEQEIQDQVIEKMQQEGPIQTDHSADLEAKTLDTELVLQSTEVIENKDVVEVVSIESNQRCQEVIAPAPVAQEEECMLFMSPPKPIVRIENQDRSSFDENREIIREVRDKEGVVGSEKKVLGFYIDAVPMGDKEKEIENKERQYKMIGQERFMRTQEKNLVEKLNKFFGEGEEDKEKEKKENKMVVEEKTETVEDDEFNFESRYYMYNPTKTCNRCKKPGHFERWCPEEVVMKCWFCLGAHRMDECVQVVCFNCNNTGHRIRDCHLRGHMVCYRCGKKGHRNTGCGVLLDRNVRVINKEKMDWEGATRCVVCGEEGHLNCKDQNGRVNKDCFEDLYEEKVGMVKAEGMLQGE